MSDSNTGFRGMGNNNPITVMEENDDELIKYDNFLNDDFQNTNSAASQQTAPANPAPINFDGEEPASTEPAPGTTAPANEENPNGEPAKTINFDGTINPADEFKAEEVIQKLEALGFKVEKSDGNDPMLKKEHEISQINQVISNLENALNASDIDLCREKAIEDIITKFRREGRENEINGEEFKLEVEYLMNEFSDNPRLISLQAAQVRNDIKSFINDKTEAKNKIQTEIKTVRDKELSENREALKTELTKFNGQVLFGQRLEEQNLINAYKNLTSGTFTEQINKDRALQAEFALYLELRPKLAQSGGGTYGEGVAAAVNALQNGSQQTTTSLGTTVSRPGAGSVDTDRLSRWKDIGKVKETDQK